LIALVGGRVCDPALGLDGPADVYLRGGRVEAVLPAGSAPPPGDWRVYDCGGRLVVPGPIDTLCHVDLGADPWREDLRTTAAAAAAGGYTAILAFTGSADPAAIAAVRGMELPVRLYPVAALTREGRLAELGLLAEAGAVAFSDWPQAVRDASVVRRALEYAGWLGRTVAVHPEDPDLARGGVMHEGVLSFALGLRGIPAAAEVVAVQRDAALQRAFGGRLHFTALSAADALPHLGGASAAVTAHHLALTEEAVRGYDTAAKLSPPLRSERDRQALLAAVEAGRLCLASGHRAVPPEEKACEYDYASFGAVALETALPLALELLQPRAFVQACAAGPAAAFGLPGGTLAPGAPADVAVFEPSEAWEVRPEALRARSRATPLAGRRLHWRVALTVVGGQVVHAAPAGVRDA
jgi:dihydroorotase